jgi:hypothetical protein
MKYTDFHKYLTIKIKGKAHIGPSISIKLGNNFNSSNIMSSQDVEIQNQYNKPLRFIVFPIKIYGENIRHLNILILDQKTKIIERYEPFDHYLNFTQINSLIEAFLYKWVEQGKIYFLRYHTTLNSKSILNDKNCGIYCVNYVMSKLKDA